jgi:Sec7-like guanine-nucleotide exchange factor
MQDLLAKSNHYIDKFKSTDGKDIAYIEEVVADAKRFNDSMSTAKNTPEAIQDEITNLVVENARYIETGKDSEKVSKVSIFGGVEIADEILEELASKL